MEETGRIIEINNNIAKIEITPTSACANCGQKSVCHGFGEKKKVIELSNNINTQVGDWVKIEIKEKNRILSTLLVLGLPIILFIIGVIIGSQISGDKLSVILGGTGLVLAYIILKIVNNYLVRKGKTLASIKEKIEPPI